MKVIVTMLDKSTENLEPMFASWKDSKDLHVIVYPQANGTIRFKWAYFFHTIDFNSIKKDIAKMLPVDEYGVINFTVSKMALCDTVDNKGYKEVCTYNVLQNIKKNLFYVSISFQPLIIENGDYINKYPNLEWYANNS